jgi:predicted phage tail protein
MPDILKENPSPEPVTTVRWVFGYLVFGCGLIGLGFFVAALAPADAIGLGGFLCFFTLGITLMIEGTKRWFASRTLLKKMDKK